MRSECKEPRKVFRTSAPDGFYVPVCQGKNRKGRRLCRKNPCPGQKSNPDHPVAMKCGKQAPQLRRVDSSLANSLIVLQSLGVPSRVVRRVLWGRRQACDGDYYEGVKEKEGRPFVVRTCGHSQGLYIPRIDQSRQITPVYYWSHVLLCHFIAGMYVQPTSCVLLKGVVFMRDVCGIVKRDDMGNRKRADLISLHAFRS